MSWRRKVKIAKFKLNFATEKQTCDGKQNLNTNNLLTHKRKA